MNGTSRPGEPIRPTSTGSPFPVNLTGRWPIFGVSPVGERLDLSLVAQGTERHYETLVDNLPPLE